MLDRFPRKEVENMKVTKLEDVHSIQYKSEKITEDELQNEHDYLVAENLTKKLLEKGFISQDEYDKIMGKNRKTFPPLLAEILT
jgi:hypothetical protein